MFGAMQHYRSFISYKQDGAQLAPILW